MSVPTLDAIRDAWDHDTGKGRDTAKAVALADTYVAEHPDEFTQLAALTLDDCVTALEVFRAAGFTDDEWRIQTWIFHKFEFQTIGGPVEAKVRLTNG